MNQAQLSAIIEKAKSDGSDTLDLSNEELESLPPEIGSLTGLVEVDLSRNQI